MKMSAVGVSGSFIITSLHRNKLRISLHVSDEEDDFVNVTCNFENKRHGKYHFESPVMDWSRVASLIKSGLSR